jgi:single-strand DNA-binding protein
VNEATVTLTGNVVTDPRHVELDDGLHITDFRLASTPRRWDRTARGWVDGETSYYTVRCFRGLARNVAASLRKGEAIVVTGSLRIREWRTDERSGKETEVEALTVGHDLRRGMTSFERVSRARQVSPEEDAAARMAATLGEEMPPDVDPETGEILDVSDAGVGSGELVATGDCPAA